MAGESAQRKYEELRDRRRQQPRWFWLLPVVFSLVVGAVGAITSHAVAGIWWPGAMLGVLVLSGFRFGPSRQEVAWRKGAEGEQAVGRALDNVAGAVALHDRRIPRSRANIDHILIARTGVWTVDSKNYTGKIETRRRGTELWVKGRNRSKLLDQAERQTSVVTKVLADAGLHGVRVRPALCFLGVEWPLLFKPKQARGVLLVPAKRLTGLAQGEQELSAADVQWVRTELDRRLQPADGSTPPRRVAQADDPGIARGRSADAGFATPQPKGQPPSAPTHETPTPSQEPPSTEEPTLRVSRWKRYGKDRLYVNDEHGATLGYVDLQSNEVVPTDEHLREAVHEAAANYLQGQ